jgi:hypothetical protein
VHDAVDEYEFKKLAGKIGVERALAVSPQFHSVPSERVVPTVYDAIESYAVAFFLALGEDVKVFFRRAFKVYFPGPDLVGLEYEAIGDYLARRGAELELALATYLWMIRRMLQYSVVKRKIIDNPVDLVGVPKLPKESSKEVYSREEIARIWRYYRERLRGDYPDIRPSNHARVRALTGSFNSTGGSFI